MLGGGKKVATRWGYRQAVSLLNSRTPSFTHSPSLSQMARATRNNISEPSKKTESQILSTVGAGRQVAKMVRNHCMVNTLVSGGS